MEQFVFVPASVYKNNNNNNKSLKTQGVTKQELPIIQAEQIPTCQIVSLKKGKNTKQIAKADSYSTKFRLVLVSSSQSCRLKYWMVWKLGFTVRLCSTTSSYKRRRSRNLLYFTWRCWYFPNYGPESKCQRQRERKLDPFQKMNIRSCKKYTRRVVPLMVLCAI